MRVKIEFDVPTFGIPALYRTVKKLLPKGNRDKVARTLDDAPLRLVSVDRIEFERPLYAPEADPEALIQDAVSMFLERNKVDCPVGIVGNSQNSLARWIKLPPVERSKIHHIMNWEAQQQIPFSLEDCTWDYLECPSEEQNNTEEGYAIDTTCLMVARKLDQVLRELKPFQAQGLRKQVDLLQTSQVTLADYIWNCYLKRQGAQLEGPGYNQTKHLLALDMRGTYTTVIIADAASFWSRDIPIGGSHFTRALAIEQKLTFRKADELKLQFDYSEDVSKVFELVTRDFCAELERSIGFFNANNRDVALAGISFFGGGFKLSGLKDRLIKTTGLELIEIPFADGIVESPELNFPLVQQHGSSMINALVVAMQRLGVGKYRFNLMPEGGAFSTKTRSAWGIEIGSHALTAVKVTRDLSQAKDGQTTERENKIA